MLATTMSAPAFAIAVAGATYGMKVYVRPKEAMDRVVGGAQTVEVTRLKITEARQRALGG